MGLTATQFSGVLQRDLVHPLGLIGCVVLLLPLSAFFSALALAIGAFARSSKEGQYYLVPVFLVTMPLTLASMVPGVELNLFTSLLPVAGVSLLMQRVIASSSVQQVPWLYFGPVLAMLCLCGWFSLRWAVFQFRREAVLFREAERLELGLWVRYWI